MIHNFKSQFLFIFLVLFFSLSIVRCNQAKISELNLLLPVHSNKFVSYKVNAENGCFSWTSSNPQVVKVETLFESSPDCSKSCLLTVVHKSSERKTLNIHAQELKTGKLLTIDVFVDTIAKLEILTTSRSIYLDSMIEVLQVQAYDLEGNVFSTVGNLPFEWEINSREGLVLTQLSLRDTALMGGTYLSKLDPTFLQDSELPPSKILIQGAKTGKANVSVILRDNFYKRPLKASVLLSVRARIQLDPYRPTYLIPQAKLKFSLWIYRRNEKKQIILPNDQYEWKCLNEKVAVVDHSGLLTALDYGTTEVTVTDLNMPESFAQAIVHVVQPASIEMRIFPIKEPELPILETITGLDQPLQTTPWYLTVRTTYLVQLQIYDHALHLITQGLELLPIELLYEDPRLIKTISRIKPELRYTLLRFSEDDFRNGLFYHVNTLDIGKTLVIANLRSIPKSLTTKSLANSRFKDPNSKGNSFLNKDPKVSLIRLDYPITKKVEAVITELIHLTPPVLRLPYTGQSNEKFLDLLTATGGSGEYIFDSSSTSVIQVNNHGYIRVVGIGEVEITVYDKHNMKNKAHSKIIVSSPSQLKFLPGKVEVCIGNYLETQVEILDSFGQSFDFYDTIKLTWSIAENQIFSFMPSSSSPSSSSSDPNSNLESESSSAESKYLSNSQKQQQKKGHKKINPHIKTLFPLKNGFSSVTVSLSLALIHEPTLKAEKMFGAFLPLKILDPFTLNSKDVSMAIGTLGSSIPIYYTGGPNPWILEPTKYFEVVEPTEPKYFEILETNGQPEIKLELINKQLNEEIPIKKFMLKCREHSEQEVKITIGNRASRTNADPAVSTAHTTLGCKLPNRVLTFPQKYLGSGAPSTSNAQNENPDSLLFFDDPISCNSDYAIEFPQRENLLFQCKSSITRDLNSLVPKNYRVKNDRDIELNIFVFDDKNRLFWNFDTLLFKFETSNSQLAQFPNLYSNNNNNKNKNNNYLYNKITPGFKTNPFNLLKTTGEVSIITSIIGLNENALTKNVNNKDKKLYSHFKNRPIQAQFFFKLISQLLLKPDYVSVFNHKANIIHLEADPSGSTYSYQTNSSRIISIAPHRSRSSVDVQPLSSGFVCVWAFDRCLEGSVPAKSNIHISEINQITIQIQERIQLGNSTTLSIAVTNDLHLPFAESQYQFMDLELVYDSDILSVPQSESIMANKLETRGMSIGNTRVHIQGRSRNGQFVKSNSINVHVFSPFKLQPPILHLFPSAQSRVHSTGGPIGSSTRIVYRVVNEKIATVDQNGLVTAHKAGTTRLIGQVLERIHKYDSFEELILAQDEIIIQVSDLTAVQIESSFTRNTVLKYNSIVLNSVGLINDVKISFSDIINLRKIIDFDWSLANNDLAEIEHLCTHPGFSVLVIGKNVGKTIATVKIHLIKTNKQFSSSTSVEVIEKLKLMMPKSIYLAPQSYARIKTNKDEITDISYSLLTANMNCDLHHQNEIQSLNQNQNQYLSLDRSNGKVIADNKNYGTSIIKIKELIHWNSFQENSHNQHHHRINMKQSNNGNGNNNNNAAREFVDEESSVILKVIVKPVNDLVLMPESVCAETLPIKSTIIYNAKLSDSLGNTFYSCNGIELEYEISNPSVIAVSHPNGNGSFIITANNDGEATLRVWLKKNPFISDFVIVKVGNEIQPISPIIHVGGKIRFQSQKKQQTSSNYLINNDPKSKSRLHSANTWSSSNKRVFKINPNNGEGQALREGTAIVQTTGNVQAQTEVRAVHVDKIQIDTSSFASAGQIYGSRSSPQNPIETLEFKFPVTFMHNEHILDPKDNFIDHNLKYTCRIKERQFAMAWNDYDHSSQNFVCGVRLYNEPQLNRNNENNKNSASAGHSSKKIKSLSDLKKIQLVVTVSDDFGSYHYTELQILPLTSSFILLYSESELTLSKDFQSTMVIVYNAENEIIAAPSDSSKLSVKRMDSDPNIFKWYQSLNDQHGRPPIYQITVLDDSRSWAASVYFKDRITGEQEQLNFEYQNKVLSKDQRSKISSDDYYNPSKNKKGKKTTLTILFSLVIAIFGIFTFYAQ
ncbi:nuclear pore membrane glycoprotein [Anaeramoeba flamelloides]|uniref:Nuclear pore membrane glycoprotein n=1 Tax=Anaeramoeba flamelloides TaxID=1746091 RepID=A0ABQ8X9C6_9EUKA|nr:nuclear pore membrane glycoprotein [Anaeramoeba flamelloides]